MSKNQKRRKHGGRENSSPKNQTPDTKKRSTAQQHGSRVVSQTFQGPLPHPNLLQEYENILTGAADRIIAMAEADPEHQRNIQITALNSERREKRLGQFLGFGIGLVGLAAAVTCASMGANTAAGIIGGSTVLGLVAVFVTGRLKGN